MSEDTVKDRLRKNLRKMQQKKKFLPPGERESTENKEDEVVEEERDRDKKRRKLQQSENGKCARRTKSSINILDAETSQATPEVTQEEPPKRFTASTGHLATYNEPQEGSSTASARHLAIHDNNVK
ncbi:hypothetical protein C2G38_2227906 [Gigaspora rosea]|uniref:Uncharacterized protein n=1 Tax=Gigaspora rosea TaxID=44941 RepID=A0A397TWI5_9GLOM|nr:hypothetical protein C2G38_2227906 [Gigaspora rosea]